MVLKESRATIEQKQMSIKRRKKKIAFVQQKMRDKWNNSYGNYLKSRDWLSDTCQHVSEGLRELGYEIRGFLPEELEKIPLTKETVLRGSVGITRKALDILGVPQPKNVDIPPSLMKFANRKIWKSTLGEVRKNKKEVFIKPLLHQKAFDGHVIFRNNWNRTIEKESAKTKDFLNNFPVSVSYNLMIDNEERFYIFKNKIIKFSDDDFNDVYHKEREDFVKKIIKSYKNSPISYIVDIADLYPKCSDNNCPNCKKYSDGTCNDSILSLIETNEAFSAGMFSISPINMAKMTEARWFEMVQKNK